MFSATVEFLVLVINEMEWPKGSRTAVVAMSQSLIGAATANHQNQTYIVARFSRLSQLCDRGRRNGQRALGTRQIYRHTNLCPSNFYTINIVNIRQHLCELRLCFVFSARKLWPVELAVLSIRLSRWDSNPTQIRSLGSQCNHDQGFSERAAIC